MENLQLSTALLLVLRIGYWAFLSLLLFEFYNQMGSKDCVAQDKISSPDRPLASGLITEEGGKARLFHE